MSAGTAWATFGVAEQSPAATPAETAFDRLFRAEYGRCVGIAQRVLGERTRAEDVAQEVFLSWHRREAADAPWAAAWLHAAAAHSALNVIRAEKRRARREATVAEAEVSDDPAALVEARERQQLVQRALRRLPLRTSTVLVLRHSGLSYAEVAAAVGCKAGDVGTLLRRGEAALRKEVERDPSQ
ncbi:MAG: sigma-70 family RNA polymerase sigma factor [Candidatus Dormibacteria bacterium]